MEWLNNISEDIIPNNITNKEEKLEVARKVAEKVKDGDVIGFGSGSTSYLAAIEIANKIEKENLSNSKLTRSQIKYWLFNILTLLPEDKKSLLIDAFVDEIIYFSDDSDVP